MSELKKLIDRAARAQSQGIVFKTPAPEPVPPKNNKKFLPWFFVSLLIIVVGVGIMLWRRSPGDDVSNLVSKVGQLAALPAGTPTVATITDLATLSKQVFFKDAQVGDRLLIYSGVGKAILYRPSENKIIAIGPLLK